MSMEAIREQFDLDCQDCQFILALSNLPGGEQLAAPVSPVPLLSMDSDPSRQHDD